MRQPEAVAPWLAGRLGEGINVQVPIWTGSTEVLLSEAVLITTADA